MSTIQALANAEEVAVIKPAFAGTAVSYLGRGLRFIKETTWKSLVKIYSVAKPIFLSMLAGTKRVGIFAWKFSVAHPGMVIGTLSGLAIGFFLGYLMYAGREPQGRRIIPQGIFEIEGTP